MTPGLQHRFDVGDRGIVDRLRTPDALDLVGRLDDFGRTDDTAGIDEVAVVQGGAERHGEVVDRQASRRQRLGEDPGVVVPFEVEPAVHVLAVEGGGDAVGVGRVQLRRRPVDGQHGHGPLVRGAATFGRRRDGTGGVPDRTLAGREQHVHPLRLHLVDEAGVPLDAHAFEVERRLELHAHSGSVRRVG